MSSILDAVKKDPERASGTGFGPLPDGFDAPGGSGGPPPGRPRTLVVAAVVLVGLAVGALASRWASGPSQVAETLVASLPEAATEAAPAPAEPTAAEPPAAVAPEAEEQAAGERPHPPKHEKKVKGEGGKPAAKAERPPKAPAARVKTGADPVAAAPAEVAPAAAARAAVAEGEQARRAGAPTQRQALIDRIRQRRDGSPAAADPPAAAAGVEAGGGGDANLHPAAPDQVAPLKVFSEDPPEVSGLDGYGAAERVPASATDGPTGKTVEGDLAALPVEAPESSPDLVKIPKPRAAVARAQPDANEPSRREASGLVVGKPVDLAAGQAKAAAPAAARPLAPAPPAGDPLAPPPPPPGPMAGLPAAPASEGPAAEPAPAASGSLGAVLGEAPAGAPGIHLLFIMWAREPARRMVSLKVAEGGVSIAHEGDQIGHQLRVASIHRDAVDVTWTGRTYRVVVPRF